MAFSLIGAEGLEEGERCGHIVPLGQGAAGWEKTALDATGPAASEEFLAQFQPEPLTGPRRDSAAELNDDQPALRANG